MGKALVLSMILVILSGCARSAPPSSGPSSTSEPGVRAVTKTTEDQNRQETREVAPASQGEKDVADRSRAAILAIKKGDWGAFSTMVHPDKGVRFSPYAYVRTQKDGDLVLTAERLKKGFSDESKYTWGSYDGTGDQIRLTIEEYYRKFIYDLDFTEAPKVAQNQILGRGNTLNNLREAYPGAPFVEYHFPGLDPKYQGMDWRSLRLVFEQKDGVWYVVGIIHDQWTI